VSTFDVVSALAPPVFVGLGPGAAVVAVCMKLSQAAIVLDGNTVEPAVDPLPKKIGALYWGSTPSASKVGTAP
jgi:hypothetical protein